MSLIVAVKVPAPVAKPINFILNLTDCNRLRNQELEIIVGEIRKNKRLEAMAGFVVGSLMYSQKVLAASIDATGKINTAGITILGICRTIGYWACLIMCIIEIIKSLMQGDSKGISKIISKYVLGFGALYLMPWIFDLIKGIFA